MIQPQSLDVTLGEFSVNYRVWAIQGRSGRYLTIPDIRFPGRRTIRFFTSDYDASRVLDAVLTVRPELEVHKLATVEVNLVEALRKATEDSLSARAESYTVLAPGEVYEFIKQLKQKTSG